MDNKMWKAPESTITRSAKDLWEQTGNLYESVMIIAKRSNQIAGNRKNDLDNKLAEEESMATNMLDENAQNERMEAISQYFERKPKPTLVATTEFLNKELYFRNKEADTDFIQDEE